MNKSLFILAVIFLAFASCERDKNNPIGEILFKIDNGLEYKYSDFQLYDSSTHIFYFKTNHPELKVENISHFTFLANGDEIYKGVLLPVYSSFLPAGPFIFSFPSFYQDYALKIEIWINDSNPDPRNDPGIIDALKEHDLLHSGLSVTINSVDISNTQLTFSFTITNRDQSDLLFLDPDKMGVNLFHYFTNGLIISDPVNKTVVFNSDIDTRGPEPWNSWNIDWLSRISTGESRTFVFNYPLDSLINPGKYHSFFEFPGLSHQINIDQLFQENARIWLGEIIARKDIVIN